MPNTKTIQKNETFDLSSGELIIKCIPGDAHLTVSRIYHNNQLIGNGEGVVIGKTMATSGDEIFIVSTINKPEGTSDHASLSVEMNDDQNSDRWDYTSYEPDYDEVIYEVTINLV